MHTMFRCNRCKNPSWHNTETYSCGKCQKALHCSCGGLLEEMTVQEIKDEQEKQRKALQETVIECRKNSKLPKWCLNAIGLRADADGHSAGQQEVNNIELGMIGDFEEAFEKRQKSS